MWKTLAWLIVINTTYPCADVINTCLKDFVKDYGAFPGEGRGYVVVEGTYLEIMKLTEQYIPYVQFVVHPAASISEVDELTKHLTG